MIYSELIQTPLGEMIISANNDGLCRAEFTVKEMVIDIVGNKLELGSTSTENAFLNATKEQLTKYFNKELKSFNIPLAPEGTDFQKHVWLELSKVKFGTTRTYKEQSEIMQSPLAIRAIASANGKNPIAIILPCHRIIGSDGQLTGYAGGLWRKKWLLEHEGSINIGQKSLF